MKFIFNDGGREAAGFKGHAGDCVARSIAIAAQLPYQQVYDALAKGNAGERKTRGSKHLSGRKTARHGIHTKRKWFGEYMASLGFVWTPTMQIGSGCKVHLRADELPSGRLVVNVSRHLTAVIDGVIYDTHDPQRLPFGEDVDKGDIHGTRCVYGYWRKA